MSPPPSRPPPQKKTMLGKHSWHKMMNTHILKRNEDIKAHTQIKNEKKKCKEGSNALNTCRKYKEKNLRHQYGYI